MNENMLVLRVYTSSHTQCLSTAHLAVIQSQIAQKLE